MEEFFHGGSTYSSIIYQDWRVKEDIIQSIMMTGDVFSLSQDLCICWWGGQDLPCDWVFPDLTLNVTFII